MFIESVSDNREHNFALAANITDDVKSICHDWW